MGVRRYSKNPAIERWQRQFDELQARCHSDYLSPTIGELLDHGIQRAEWACNSKGYCFHTSEEFALGRYGRKLKVRDLRWNYVCSACGRKKPRLHLLAN